MLNEKTFGFKFLIALDRLFNVCMGGSFQECYSTRAYKLSITAKPLYVRKRWDKRRRLINKCFWRDHCKDSYEWEIQLKEEWLRKNKHLV